MDVGTPGTRMADYLRDHHDKVIGRWTELVVAGVRGRTTADEVRNPGDLRLRTWVNGDLRQDSRTSDLIFGCQELVDFISQTCTLHPGDLILTGTPNGVGMALDPPQFLRPGDWVRIEIEGLGEIQHAVE